jgi:hypothetical protein
MGEEIMNRYAGDVRIRAELRCGANSLESVDDRFYRDVWRRIAAGPEHTPQNSWNEALEDLGSACWQAVPACFLLVVLVGGYVLYNPPEPLPEVMLSAESYALDLSDTLVDDSLLYQITNSMPDSAQGIKP